MCFPPWLRLTQGESPSEPLGETIVDDTQEVNGQGNEQPIGRPHEANSHF